MTSLSFGQVTDSKINMKYSVADIFQNASLTVKNTDFTNEKDFKFSLQEAASLYLENSRINRNKFLSVSNYSQAYV